jgi:hypothetical protein
LVFAHFKPFIEACAWEWSQWVRKLFMLWHSVTFFVCVTIRCELNDLTVKGTPNGTVFMCRGSRDGAPNNERVSPERSHNCQEDLWPHAWRFETSTLLPSTILEQETGIRKKIHPEPCHSVGS